MDPNRDRRRLIFAAGVVGFGGGGFFDGILLHQVLQWHHLLSLVRGPVFRDIGTQILADGLFHVLMYIVSAAGLWLLWRRRSVLSDSRVGSRAVAGGALMGFGLWNVVDVAFFHWVLVIHRIRIGVPDPMIYDLGWLAAFGLVPLLLAWSLLRRHDDGGGTGGRRAAVTLGILALIGAPVAALPIRNSSSALVMLPPGRSAGEALNVVVEAGAPILWIDPRGRLLVVRLDTPGATHALYRAGAVFVTRSPAVAGCAAAPQA